MKRWSFFVYGVFCYLLFFLTYAYMAAFMGNLLVGNFLVPKTIDSRLDSPLDGGFHAAAIDLALIALFALQHSVMARPAFKRAWTRLVPQPIERSTYVLLSCVVTIVLMWQWRALDITIWNVRQPLARGLLWGLFAAGWLLVPTVSLMISHFDLFGVRQVWLYLRREPDTALPFRTPLLYSRVRHPLYLGWTLAFWATPTMTLGHLLFAGAMTLYMGLAALVEERDLVGHFGNTYRDYQRRVPMFVPRWGAASQSPTEITGERAASRPEPATK